MTDVRGRRIGGSQAMNSVLAGRIISGLVVVILLADGLIDLVAPQMIATAMAETGFASGLAPLLGTIVILCALVYAIPRTAVLGAILTTGFLGGAVCTHVRMGEVGSPPELIALLIGLLTWGGLYLREPRLRALLPAVT